MGELTKELLKLKSEMDNSKYEYQHEYSYQVCMMFTDAAGYVPEASVRDVWKLIDKILRGVIL